MRQSFTGTDDVMSYLSYRDILDSTSNMRYPFATTCSASSVVQQSIQVLAESHLCIWHHTIALWHPHNAPSYHIVPALSDKTHMGQHILDFHHGDNVLQKCVSHTSVEPKQSFYGMGRPAFSPAAPKSPTDAVRHSTGALTSRSLSDHLNTTFYCSPLCRNLLR